MTALKCIEPAIAIGGGICAYALGALDGGLSTGMAIGGAAIVRAFTEARSKHGLESRSHIEKTRLAILREVALEDLNESARDAVGITDAALSRYLVECIPTREELGAAAVNSERYPAAACKLILDRLAKHDAMFRDDQFARDFTTRVMTAALREGLNNPDYVNLLSIQILTAVGQAVAEIRDGQIEDRERDVAFQNTILESVLALNDARIIAASEAELRTYLIRLLSLDQNVTVDDLVGKLRDYAVAFDVLRDKVAAIEAVDNRLSNLKGAASDALERRDLDGVRHYLNEAAQTATDRAAAHVRSSAQAYEARADADLLALDWVAANTAWNQAASMMMPFDVAASEKTMLVAGHCLEDFGKRFAQDGALVAAGNYWRTLEFAAAKRGDPDLTALMQLMQGNVLFNRGNLAEGDAGFPMLADAVTLYRTAFVIYTSREKPFFWALTMNDFGNALTVLGRRTEGEEGTAMLTEAISAFRDALSIFDTHHIPEFKLMTLHNLANSLMTLGLRIENETGTSMLSDAAAAIRRTLDINTRSEHPLDWSHSQCSLGNILMAQSLRADDTFGLMLINDALSAYRGALAILTPEYSPFHHEMVNNNIALAEAVIAERGWNLQQ